LILLQRTAKTLTYEKQERSEKFVKSPEICWPFAKLLKASPNTKHQYFFFIVTFE